MIPDSFIQNIADRFVFLKIIIWHFSKLIFPQRVGIMVASHNEDTTRFAIKMMEELNIKPEDKVGA